MSADAYESRNIGERYARCVVYRRWSDPRADERFRPHASFDTMRQAVNYVDFAREDDGHRGWHYIIRDIEHIDMGDMLTHPECAGLIALIRANP